MFLYEFAEKTAQKPDTVATYIRRNEKIFKNHVERREKQLWLDEKAVKILLKKYPEVQRKKYPWWKNETEFQEAMVSAIKGLWDNQEILQKELDGILTTIEELQDAMNHTQCILCPFWSYFFSFLAVSDTFLALSSTFFYIVWNIIGIYMHSRYGCATETDDFTTYSDILIRDTYTAIIINFS